MLYKIIANITTEEQHLSFIIKLQVQIRSKQQICPGRAPINFTQNVPLETVIQRLKRPIIMKSP